MLYQKPSRSNFQLQEMKSKDSASLILKAHTNIDTDGVITEVPYHGTYEIVPHPDLISLLEGLKIRFANHFGYTHFKAVVEAQDFKATKAQLKYIEQAQDKVFDDIKVNGVSISGSDRNKLVIKGTYKGCAMNTKPLSFNNEEYGEELESVWNQIVIEVYDYLFEGKKAQLDIVFEKEEAFEMHG